MAVRPDYITGTITLTNNSLDVVGEDTLWLLAPVRPGDVIFQVDGEEEWEALVASVEGNTELTLTKPWPGGTATDATYAIRFQPDGARYTAAAVALLEQLANGNLTAFAALIGAPGKIPVFTGPGAMELLNSAELVNGVVYNVMVDELSDRAAYDAEDEGFSVLVANVGDGRSALYNKKTDDLADWSDPAYITGEIATVTVGPVDLVAFDEAPSVVATPVGGGVQLDFSLPAQPTFQMGTVTTGGPGTAADVDIVLTPTGYLFNFTIPEGEGFDFKGAYAAPTNYVKGDVVTYQNSSYIALGATTGNLPTNSTYWSVLAAAGVNGESFVFRSAYNPATAYVKNDNVTYNGSTFIAKGPTTGNLPTNATYWDPVAVAGSDGTDGVDGTSFIFLGDYNPVTPYIAGDAVAYLGSSYIAKGATTGNLPTNATYWDVLAQRGADGAGTVVAVTSTLGLTVDASDPTVPIVNLAIEENTFTPSIKGETSAGVGAHSIQNGYYWKLGPLVFFAVTVRWTTHTGTGFMNVDGIPYSPPAARGLVFSATFSATGVSDASALVWSGNVFRIGSAVTGAGRNVISTGTSTLIANGFFIADE